MIFTETAPPTALQSLTDDYVRYNAWANCHLVDWLKTKPTEKMERSVPSSFPTIKKTLLHIWKTQLFWLDVLKVQQRSYDEDATSYYEDDPEMNTAEVFGCLGTQSQEIAGFVHDLDERALREKVPTITPWFESNQPRYELIQQCMNHSTYHRGQIVTIGRNIGMTDAPMTDFNYYLLRIK